MLRLEQSAAANPSWSPYRALILMLVALFREIQTTFSQLAAHLREAEGQAEREAAQEAELEAEHAAASLPTTLPSARRKAATDQSAAKPRRTRPQAAEPTAPEGQKPPLPLWERTRVKGRPAGTPTPAIPRSLSTFRPPKRTAKNSSRTKPISWHAHFITISKR
jgi:hypothetical protein